MKNYSACKNHWALNWSNCRQTCRCKEWWREILACTSSGLSLRSYYRTAQYHSKTTDIHAAQLDLPGSARFSLAVLICGSRSSSMHFRPPFMLQFKGVQLVGFSTSQFCDNYHDLILALWNVSTCVGLCDLSCSQATKCIYWAVALLLATFIFLLLPIPNPAPTDHRSILVSSWRLTSEWLLRKVTEAVALWFLDTLLFGALSTGSEIDVVTGAFVSHRLLSFRPRCSRSEYPWPCKSPSQAAVMGSKGGDCVVTITDLKSTSWFTAQEVGADSPSRCLHNTMDNYHVQLA